MKKVSLNLYSGKNNLNQPGKQHKEVYMLHLYKCDKCGSEIEDNIPTFDIIDSKGIVDQIKLSERINQPRTCVCGGILRHKISSFSSVLWFNDSRRGKISNRFGK